jgi:GT2 family glycosyltransferase
VKNAGTRPIGSTEVSMGRPDLSVIVASYNTEGLTRECLRSVFAASPGLALEVIVVDDCSPDASAEMVRSEFPNVKLLVNERNSRYAITNNRGLKAATGRYLLLLNTDTVVLVDGLTKLVRFMDAHTEVDAAGPKLLNPDGSVQHCIRSFPGVGVMALQSIGLHKIWPGNPITDRYYNTDFDYSTDHKVESIGTTAFIIRRSAYEAFGGLDERFSWAFCDQAYCLSLAKQGGTIWYVAGAEVTHYGSASINQNTGREIDLLHKALKLLYDSYLSDGTPKWKRQLVYAGIDFRRLIKRVENSLSKDKRLIKGPGAPKRASA